VASICWDQFVHRIAEFGGNRIRVIDAAGTIRTIAGNGLQGFSGDGGAATNASLNGPTDVKVDGQGNVYIADSLNSAIRKLTPVTAVSAPVISKITNAASLAGGPVSPGERVVLTGTALGPNSKVAFGNTAAPVLFSSLTSAMVVVPYEVAGQTASSVVVTTGGVNSAPFAVQIAPSSPGIYTTSGDGVGQAMAYVEDGSLNSPDNPSPAGSIVRVLCTGAGVTNPAVATGVPVPSTTPSPALPVTATLSDMPVSVEQAYSLPGTIGQFAVDVRLPYNIQSNASASLQIMVGKAVSQYASIAVQGAPDDGSDSSSDSTSSGSSDGSSDGLLLRSRRLPKHPSRPLPPVR